MFRTRWFGEIFHRQRTLVWAITGAFTRDDTRNTQPDTSSAQFRTFSDIQPKKLHRSNYNYWAHLLKSIEHTCRVQQSTHRNSPFKKLCLLLKPLREPPQSVSEGNSDMTFIFHDCVVIQKRTDRCRLYSEF